MRKKSVTQNGLGIIKTIYGNYNPLVKDVQNFASIRSWGDKNSATTHDGLKVERQDYIFIEGYGMVKCVPYELHFVWEDKSGKRGRWVFMCSCGSPAGIISYKAMSGMMSPELGEYVLCCLAHTTSKMNTGIGRHADNSSE